MMNLAFAIITSLVYSALAADENTIPVGTVLPFAGLQIPGGWLACDGRILAKAEYPELHSTIGDTFKSDLYQSETHFQIPDLRGRAVIGAGQGSKAGLLTDRKLGSYLGVEKHALTIEEMPCHTHAVKDPGHTHNYYHNRYENEGYVYHYTGVRTASYDYYKFDNNWQTTGSQKTGITLASNGSSRPHENMPPSAVLNYIIRTDRYVSPNASTTKPPKQSIPPPKVKSWPKPQHLLALWPLDSRYGLHDISGNQFHFPDGVFNLTTGPFFVPKSAVLPEAANRNLMEINDIKFAEPKSSFTVAMFFRKQPPIADKQVDEGGGIFEFLDKYASNKAFQLRYINSTTIEVAANNQQIGLYTMIQQKGIWTFMAFTFEKSSKTFSIYSKHGLFGRIESSADIGASNTFNNNGIRLGYASRWKQGLHVADAVSCLAVYAAALTRTEIRRLHDACRVVHGAVACGKPKIDVPAIPSSTVVTGVPVPGQFPYVTLVRFKDSPACSATIIDSYWLLSSKTCFEGNLELRLYTVVVAEHDFKASEDYTRIHTIQRLVIGNKNNLALIEVHEPIDFSNDFVNDVCLVQGDEISELMLDTSQFVVGWGIHGRQPLLSQSLGRYIPGSVMSEVQCREAWGLVDYDPSNELCFMSTSVDKDVPCSGDEGSPLLVQAKFQPEKGLGPRLVQVGVYRKRDNNCSPVKPALFTNIANYRNWIIEKIACSLPGVAYPADCPQS